MPNPGDRAYWRRRAFASAKLAGLTTEERHELAEALLKRDVTSWEGMYEAEFRRICDALDGHHYIATLLAQRGPKP